MTYEDGQSDLAEQEAKLARKRRRNDPQSANNIVLNPETRANVAQWEKESRIPPRIMYGVLARRPSDGGWYQVTGGNMPTEGVFTLDQARDFQEHALRRGTETKVVLMTTLFVEVE